jgi:O-antigen/teichoic acid export membrane protein
MGNRSFAAERGSGAKFDVLPTQRGRRVTGLKSLSKNLLIYGGGLLLKRAISFVMIPFYTRYLVPADYGIMELLELSTFIAAFFIGFGVLHSVFRFCALAKTDEERRKTKTNGLLTIICLGGPITVVLAAASPVVARVTVGDPGMWALATLAMAGVFFGEAQQMLLGFFRVDSRPLAYGIYSLVSTLVSLGLNILFIAGLGLGVKGIFLSSFISSAVLTLVLVVPFLPGGGWRPDRVLIRSMLAYCMPFIPSGLMAFTVNFADRYFLRMYTDLTTVGVYALGYKFGMVGAMLVAMPFGLVWSAQAFDIANGPRPRDTYGRVLTYYSGVLIALSAGVSVLAPEVLQIMATPAYLGAAAVVPPVAWGILLLNVSDVLRVGLLLEKKTGWLPVIWGVSTVVNLALNFLWIPAYGMAGAAWSTLVSFLVQAVMTHVISRRIYPITVEWGRLGVLVGAGVGVEIGALFLPQMPPYTSAAVKTAGMVGIALLILLSPGFMKKDEREALRRIRARLFQRAEEAS